MFPQWQKCGRRSKNWRADLMQKVPDYIKKQLSIPGLPVPEPKPELISKQAQLALRLNQIECRLLSLELELSLLKIQIEKGVK
jgi:hypothetical protein